MSAVFSPVRWFRRRAELKELAPRREAIEAAVSQSFGVACTLVPAVSKGGHDQIYYAVAGGLRRAVVRVNNRHRVKPFLIDPRRPLVPLAPAERLAREWDAYGRLHPVGLSPQPLWRGDDAIACSWLDRQRASVQLIRHRALVWPFAAAAFPAVRLMHEAGVVHLDLNLGNVLFRPEDAQLAFIDFEYGPAAWVTPQQQMAFDYLRLIDDLLRPRRGGRLVLAEPDRLLALVRDAVPAPVAGAPTSFALAHLRHLACNPGFCIRLAAVFRRLQG